MCAINRQAAARKLRSFVMIEVIVSLTVLSIGLTGLLQSFTSSLKAVRRENIITNSTLLANYLLESYQNQTPLESYGSGDFGQLYPEYSWETEVSSEEPLYRVHSDWLRENMQYMIWVTVRVWYHDPRGFDPILGAEASTCLMRFERFSFQTRQFMVENSIFEY